MRCRAADDDKNQVSRASRRRQAARARFCSWMSVETVGDESAYVSALRKHLRTIVPLIRDYFSDRRKYFAHYCLKLATQIVNKFLGALFRCKPLSITGAEQLLLDTHSLKTFLLSMPSLGSSIVIKPPTPFTTCIKWAPLEFCQNSNALFLF